MSTSIEWADEVWNPTTGCTPVSEGCRNCYAASFAHRGLTEAHRGLTVMRDGRAVFNGKIKLHEDRLTIPLRWRKPRRIFVDSMSDLFHESVPFEFIDKVFAAMTLCPQHEFLILTKRPERMAEYLDLSTDNRYEGIGREALRMSGGDHSGLLELPLANVWLGVSCEDQATADERIPHLLRCPAAVRFLSCEPLLGPLDLESTVGTRTECPTCGEKFEMGCLSQVIYHDGDHSGEKPNGTPVRPSGVRLNPIHWVIIGGESGPNARPFNVQWARDIRDQCKAAGVPFYLKQLGAMPVDENLDGDLTRGVVDMEMDCRRAISDRKGGDMSEWPKDLRVREMPKEAIGG